MRFDAIELRRLGVFADSLRLDLSGGSEGVHLIHGPNEAGKSTVLRALHWALFGFPHGRHDFLYGNDTRAGGVVRNGTATLAFLRKKGRVRTLESPGKEALKDDALRPFLGNMTEEFYERFHGLDHHQLTAGGREIIEAKGEAGQALFAAAGGLQAVTQLAGALQAEYEGIFKPRGSTPSLNAVLAAHKEATRAMRAAELRTDDYRKLETAVEDARNRCDELARELEEVTARCDWLERCQRAYGYLTELGSVRAAIEAFGDAPPLRENFARDIQQTQKERAAAVKDLDEAHERTQELRAQLETLAVDARIIEHSARIQEIADESSEVRRALSDRVGLLSNTQVQREQFERILHDLGRDDAMDNPRAILPSVPQRAAVVASAEKYGGLAAKVEAAEQSRRRAIEALEAAEQALAALPAPAGTGPVEAALAHAQRVLGDEERLETLEQRIAEQQEQLEARLQRRGRWQGALEQVRTLAVPDEAEITRFKEDLDKSAQKREQLEEQLAKLDDESKQVTAELKKLARGGSIPTEEELGRLRARRDAAWSALRDAWLAGSPADGLPAEVRERVLLDAVTDGYAGGEPLDGFGWRIQRADEVADRLRHEAERVAEHASAEARLEQLAQDRDAWHAALQEHADHHEALEAGWNALWEASGVAHGTPAEMLAWRKEWAALVEGIEQLAADAAEESRLRQRVNDARATLMDAWRTAHPAASEFDTATLGAMVSGADEWRKQAQQSRAESDRLEQDCARLRNVELPAAETAVRDAAKAMKAWQTEWKGQMKAIGLPGDASTAQAHAMLNGLDELKEALEDFRKSEDRIREIDERHGQFQADAAEVFAAAGYEPGDAPPEEAARALNALREQHALNLAARNGIEQQIAHEEERERTARRNIKDASDTLEALCTEAGVDAPEHLLEAAETGSQLRAALAKRERLEDELSREAQGEPLPDFEARLLEEDAETLGARLLTLGGERDRLKDELGNAQQELGAARDRLQSADGADAAAAAAQEAAEHHARALELTEEYARLALAHGILQSAIQRHQEEHQDPMLEAASRHFEALTGGSFQSLRTGFEGDGGAVLLGVRPDDREVPVEGMSDGTADQLYLALRLAAIELRAQEGVAMPLILDDVLVNFDNERAAAALRAFADLSKHTQVLMFTHHAHLVELARETLPKSAVFIHELPANGAGNP